MWHILLGTGMLEIHVALTAWSPCITATTITWNAVSVTAVTWNES